MFWKVVERRFIDVGTVTPAVIYCLATCNGTVIRLTTVGAEHVLIFSVCSHEFFEIPVAGAIIANSRQVVSK